MKVWPKLNIHKMFKGAKQLLSTCLPLISLLTFCPFTFALFVWHFYNHSLLTPPLQGWPFNLF